ncbi:MAG: hypothetical protein ACREMS_03750, partial [Gemmatimonadaceae bacterium]
CRAARPSLMLSATIDNPATSPIQATTRSAGAGDFRQPPNAAPRNPAMAPTSGRNRNPIPAVDDLD